MVSFGAVVVEPLLSKNFYGKTRPVSGTWVPEALAVSGFSRDEHLDFDEPGEVMEALLAFQEMGLKIPMR